jgi:hypothetical protein
VIEPRIYRAAFLPALLAAIVAMFSLESQPRALPQAAPADVLFEGTSAANTVRGIVERTPDRRVGAPGDVAVSQRVAGAFRRFGLTTTIDRFSDGGADLVNVVGRRPGLSRRQVVVVVARDAPSVPDATGTAADTAALIEFGRVLEGRATKKTIVLASVDGSSLGHAGARRLARTVGGPGPVDAVIVLSNLGAARPRGPMLVGWSNSEARASIGLRRTAANALRNEVGDDGGGFGSPLTQLGRVAFPVGVGAQAVLIDEGLDAIRLSASGELAPPEDQRSLGDLDAERYEEIGRAALRLVFTLDEQPRSPEHGPPSFVTVGGRVAPSWSLMWLALGLILPALVASIDALARARRRGEAVLPWLSWVVAGIVPFAAGLALAELLVLVGLADDAPPSPLDPSAAEPDGAAIAVLGAVALTIGLAWILTRTSFGRGDRGRPDAAAPGAGVVVALVLCGLALAAWAVNPFTGLALALPLHLWMLAVLTDVPARTRVWLTLVGLLPAAVIVFTYAQHLRMGPVEGAWYLFLLVTGHHVGLVSALLGCVALGLLASVLGIAVAHLRRSGPREPRRSRRGGRSAPEKRPALGPAGPPLERVRR